MLIGTTVKPVLSGHSKVEQKLGFKTAYRLVQVKSIAECSDGSILQYFRPSLNFHLSFRPLFLSNFEWLSVSNCLDPDHDTHSVCPELGSNCLQRLSTDDKNKSGAEVHKSGYLKGALEYLLFEKSV